MNGYVIVRNAGEYVAPAGSLRSYTRDIREARIFPTREEARIAACSNESVRSVAAEFRGKL